MMWVQARTGGYSQQDIFFGLVLPEPDLINERCLTLDEMKAVIDGAPEPFKTLYWLLAETGVRCGEACGLPVRNLLLDQGVIRITQSVWHGQIQTVKSLKGNRACEISPQLGGTSPQIPPLLAAKSTRGSCLPRRTGRLGMLTWYANANSIPCWESWGSSVAAFMLSGMVMKP